ncbi:MAG: hypothetical protein ACK4M7_06810, partial [Burkholderiales bacterium]
MSCLNPSVGPHPKKQLTNQPQAKQEKTTPPLYTESEAITDDITTIQPIRTQPLAQDKLYDAFHEPAEQAYNHPCHEPAEQAYNHPWPVESSEVNQPALINPSNRSSSLSISKHSVKCKPSTEPQPPWVYQSAIKKNYLLAYNQDQVLQPKQKAAPFTCMINEEVQVGMDSITVTARGGHTVTLTQREDGWIARVNEHLPIGFSRPIDLPVVAEKADFLNVAFLTNHEPAWYQQHIHVVFPEQDKQVETGYVYIGKMGLMGGGISEYLCPYRAEASEGVDFIEYNWGGATDQVTFRNEGGYWKARVRHTEYFLL